MKDLNQILEDCIAFTVKKFEDMRDKQGLPMVLHSLYVMSMAETIEDKIVAILHDVLKDTSATVADLKNLGVPHRLVQDVVVLTHLKGIAYDEYLRIIKKQERARRIKNLDMDHNSSPERINGLDLKTAVRLTTKYLKGRRVLNG